jgi:hypothetical protein
MQSNAIQTQCKCNPGIVIMNWKIQNCRYFAQLSLTHCHTHFLRTRVYFYTIGIKLSNLTPVGQMLLNTKDPKSGHPSVGPSLNRVHFISDYSANSDWKGSCYYSVVNNAIHLSHVIRRIRPTLWLLRFSIWDLGTLDGWSNCNERMTALCLSVKGIVYRAVQIRIRATNYIYLLVIEYTCYKLQR